MLGRTVITCIFISTLFSVSGTSYAQPCLPQSDDLAHWWEAEGTPVDTVTGVTGQTVGSVTYEAGPVGLAFRFDGSSFIQVPDSPDLTLGDTFTLATWVRIDQRTPRMPFLSHDEGPGFVRKWIFWYDEYGHGGQGGGALRFHINSPALGSQDPIYALWQPVIGQWYHVAGTKDGSNYALFIDGVQVATSIHAASIPDPAAPFMIGSAEGLHTRGAIDEAQIYRRALSEGELLALGSGPGSSCNPAGPWLRAYQRQLRTIGTAPYEGTIAKVSDPGADGEVTVTAVSVPPGILLDELTNDEGIIRARIGATCESSPGLHEITIMAENSSGSTAVANVAVELTGRASTPTAYAIDYASQTLKKVDLLSREVVNEIPLGTRPSEVVASPDMSRLFISYDYIGQTQRIDLVDVGRDETIQSFGAFSEGSNPLLLSTDGKRLFSGAYPFGPVQVFETDTLLETSRFSAQGCYPLYAGTSSDGRKIFMSLGAGACSGGQVRLVTIDSDSLTVLSVNELGPFSWGGLAVHPDGKRVFIAKHQFNEVLVIDTELSELVATIQVGVDPWDLVFSADGSKVYVENWLSDYISVIDTTHYTEIARIETGPLPSGMRLTPDGTLLYVGTGGGELLEIDTFTDTVIHRTTVGFEMWSFVLVGFPSPDDPISPMIDPGGPSSFCEGGSVVLTASPAGQNYLWSNGQTGDSITVTTQGSYYATATSTTSCSTLSSAPVHVTVNPRPATPTISSTTTAGVTTLTASPAYDWLWSTGQTTQSIDVSTSGTFSVTAINSSGCSATSAPFHVTISDAEQTVLDAGDVSLSLSSPQPGATLTVTTIEEPENVAPLPEGYFAIGDESGSAMTAYEIRMDPPVEGTVEVAFDVSWVTSLSALMSLRVLHGEINSSTGQLELIDRTVRHEWDEVDPSKRRIVASVTSLSPFLIVRVKAPTIVEITGPAAPVARSSSVTMEASFTDPDLGDVHTAVWEWGDGTNSVGQVTEPSFSASGELPGTVTGTHTYAAAGVYTVTLAITDNTHDGGTATRVYRYVVVYDPDNGFVTGGGWIASPAGAYFPDPGIAGKANFGFVSRYARGANVPSGNTDFHFQAGSFRFRSTAYEWLVISGARAQFKGWGTVNGGGDFGFLLTAIDGERPGGGGADRFRIKIWERTTGSVVYDNRRGSSDDLESADPQLLGGGSIVIHPK